MEVVRDFEDILKLLSVHKVRYLIIGGIAFIYHAKPRFTKDIDLWIDETSANVARANKALAEFGSPMLLDSSNSREILQIGIAPSRIDILLHVGGVRFDTAWKHRIKGRYGHAPANFVDLDTLIRIKDRIKHPRHQEDVRVLREVHKRRRRKTPAMR